MLDVNISTADYIRRLNARERAEREMHIWELDSELQQSKKTISELKDEINRLKAKLEENGIEY